MVGQDDGDELAWKAIADGYERLAADPAALADYRVEAEMWIASAVGPFLGNAAEEYPEYNTGRL